MNFKIVVFTKSQDNYRHHQTQLAQLGLAKETVLWGDSSQFSRLDLINSHLAQNLFFIDHDCLPDRDSLMVVSAHFAELRQLPSLVVTGRYKNPVAPSLLQRVHNLIANGWLESSYLKGSEYGFLLGGVFLVRASEALVPVEDHLYWGAEDKSLANQLHDAGFKFILSEKLYVNHDTSKSVLHFFKRAWLHGQNEVRYIKKNKSSVNFFYWLRKVDSANSGLIPLILLHFCIQKLAILFQTIRPSSK